MRELGTNVGGEQSGHVILTDFELGDNYVVQKKNGSWNGVYVPAFPAGQPHPAVGPGVPAASSVTPGWAAASSTASW